MKKLLKWDLQSIAFVFSTTLFGTSLVLLAAYELTHRETVIYTLFSISTFFTSLSLILQIIAKRKAEKKE
ncbi:MAG: hypothetical protein WAV93_02640 [Bacteroidales bacterium]